MNLYGIYEQVHLYFLITPKIHRSTMKPFIFNRNLVYSHAIFLFLSSNLVAFKFYRYFS